MGKPLPDVEEQTLPEPELSIYERVIVRPDGGTHTAMAAMPNPAGRPSKFNPEHHPIHALGMAAEGFSIGMIACVFDVEPKTMYNWRDKHPEMGEIWPLLSKKRRAAIEYQALRNAKGENSSKSAHGMLAQMDRYDEEHGTRPEGSEYLDPRVHKVENDKGTVDALSAIAAQLAAQQGMTLKTRETEE